MPRVAARPRSSRPSSRWRPTSAASCQRREVSTRPWRGTSRRPVTGGRCLRVRTGVRPAAVRSRVVDVAAARHQVDVVVEADPGDARHQLREPVVELGVVATAAVERVHVHHPGGREQLLDQRVDPAWRVVGDLPGHDVLDVAEARLGGDRDRGVVDQPAVQPLVAVEVVGPLEDGDVGERVHPYAVRRLRRRDREPLVDLPAGQPRRRRLASAAVTSRPSRPRR